MSVIKIANHEVTEYYNVDDNEYEDTYSCIFVNGKELDVKPRSFEKWFVSFIIEKFSKKLKTLTGKSGTMEKHIGYYGLGFVTNAEDYRTRKFHNNWVDGAVIQMYGGFSAYEKVLNAIGYTLVEIPDDRDDWDVYELRECSKITSLNLYLTKMKAIDKVLKIIKNDVYKRLCEDPIEFDNFYFRNLVEKIITENSINNFKEEI